MTFHFLTPGLHSIIPTATRHAVCSLFMDEIEHYCSIFIVYITPQIVYSTPLSYSSYSTRTKKTSNRAAHVYSWAGSMGISFTSGLHDCGTWVLDIFQKCLELDLLFPQTVVYLQIYHFSLWWKKILLILLFKEARGRRRECGNKNISWRAKAVN